MFSLLGSGCSVRYLWIRSLASSAVNLQKNLNEPTYMMNLKARATAVIWYYIRSAKLSKTVVTGSSHPVTLEHYAASGRWFSSNHTWRRCECDLCIASRGGLDGQSLWPSPGTSGSHLADPVHPPCHFLSVGPAQADHWPDHNIESQKKRTAVPWLFHRS